MFRSEKWSLNQELCSRRELEAWGGNLVNWRSVTIHRGCYNQISLSHRRQQRNYTVLLRVHITLLCQFMEFPFNLHSPPVLDYPQAPSWQISKGTMSCHSAPCPETVLAVHCRLTAQIQTQCQDTSLSGASPACITGLWRVVPNISGCLWSCSQSNWKIGLECSNAVTEEKEESNDEAIHYLWGAFNPGMLTPDSQVFHDTHSTKFMVTGILLSILLTVTTNPITKNVCGIKNSNAKYVKLTQTKCPGRQALSLLCLPKEGNIF